jgi:hypothetical protein
MPLKTIAYITPWNRICGVAQFAELFVHALQQEHFEFIILGDRDHPAYKSTGLPDLETKAYYQVFDTGHQIYPARIDEAVYPILASTDLVVLNYQDYLHPDKQGILDVLKFCRSKGIPFYIQYHDSYIHPELPINSVTGNIIPTALAPLFSGVDSPLYIVPQPIPEFNLHMPSTGITHNNYCTFGLGRTQLSYVAEAVRNTGGQLTLFVPTTPETVPEGVKVISGFLSATTLAHQLNQYDGCIIWYPEIQGISTSSALRFAIGARTLPIMNITNWNRDLVNSGAFLPVEEDLETALRGIQELYLEERIGLRRIFSKNQQSLIQQIGWSQIAKQYKELFLCRK